MVHKSGTSKEWLSFYKDLASARGGTCTSEDYINSKTKLRWVCAEGHVWEAIPENVRAGHWCKICGNVRQGREKANSIDSARQLALANGGECLSNEYINNSTKLTWRCASGHEWNAATGSIKQGSWCPVCAGKKPPDMALNELQNIARSRNGQCLSDQYAGAKVKLRWQCEVGHEWEAIPDSVKRGTWCPHCAGHLKLTLDAMKQLALSKGGECLATRYINSNEKLQWRCAAGHEWLAVAYHVRAGHWCPICSAGNSERICRDIFEQMFGLPFPKARPNWLLGNKGRTMELDGYCESLGLAFEFHGHQHYQSVSFFQHGEKSLEKRKQDDAHKARLCHDKGVQLITVPYTTPMNKVPELIYCITQELGVCTLLNTPAEVNVADFVLPELIAAMQIMAKERGGDCLSPFYVNNSTKLRWRCAEGHLWDAVPGSIQQGSWCPKCVGKLSPNEAYQQLQEIAASRGGRCLSAGYIDGGEKLRWQCASGHEWKAAPYNIRGGSWCHECAKKTQGPKRLGLELCQQTALAKGGKCLSNEYVNSGTKLTWQCAEGHEWNSIPDSVVRLGTWCPRCMGKRSWETRLLKSAKGK